MRNFAVFFALFALFAMAAAQGVNVVDDNPDQVHVVDNNDPGQANINNPDPAFGRPTYEQPDISPAFVNGPPRYPAKQYNNPYARGGK